MVVGSRAPAIPATAGLPGRAQRKCRRKVGKETERKPRIRLLSRIPAARTERITAQNTPDSLAEAADQAVLFKGIESILGAGWGKTTGMTEIGSQQSLVGADQNNTDFFQHRLVVWSLVFCRSLVSCFSAAVFGRPAKLFLTTRE